MKFSIMNTLTFAERESELPLLLGTPDGLRWYRATDVYPPREADHGSSQNLWLALSDGRVVRGYASFFRTRQPAPYADWDFHSWSYYENAHGGLIPRTLSRSDKLKVEAWSFTVLPAHPLR